MNEEVKTEEIKTSKKGGKKGWIILLVILGLALIGGAVYLLLTNKDSNKKEVNTETEVKKSAYYMSGNSLQKFDLAFLKLENEKKNMIYSPLSIKYALEMLAEGAKGTSKSQIDGIIGEYVAKKYTNSKNMSFANAMFIRDSFKDKVLPTYAENLTNKYNAEVIYDSFNSAKTINNWISEKTLKLLDNLVDDGAVQQLNFALVNALAIDMSWNYKIQASSSKSDAMSKLYSIKYSHEKYSEYIPIITDDNEYGSTKFDNNKMNAKTVEIGASINNYDIVKTLGEANIRKTVGDEYKKWLVGDGKNDEMAEKDVNKFLDGYIKELNSNYKKAEGSTDFYLYDDIEVKTFAKDLKTYNGNTLQYIGIMPKNVSLDSYINNIEVEKVNNIISNLKDIKSENFKEGVVTKVIGNIPLFKFDYKLKLQDDLKTLGVTDIFAQGKADLSNLTSEKGNYISVEHKANIDFSNDGIKASAATIGGGLGDASGGFDYLYDVPVEIIDLTFNKPYMFLIRDKNSGEVWFSGTVYEPTKGIEKTE